MVPDAPGQPLPPYTPSTPTAPGNATGSGTVGAPTAPGQVQGAGSGNSPTAPAGVVPSTGTPVQANVTGTLLDGLGASFTFVPLLYAGEYSGRPYFTADGLPVGGFTGNGSFLWYDATQWKLSHKIALYGTPLIRFHASAGSEMSPDDVTTWSAIIGSGTPVVTVVTSAAAPTAPDTVLPEGAGNSPTAPGGVQPEDENPNSPSAPGSVQPVSPSTPDPSDAVRYSAQTTTTEQKTQARANIGAAASDHNHDGVYATAAQGALAEFATLGYLYPEDFGVVVGDLTPSVAVANASALTAAFAASAAQGKTLVIVGSIYVSGEVLASGGVKVKGLGGASLIQLNTAHNGITIDPVNGSYGLIIDGLHIGGQGPTTHDAAGFYGKKNDLSYLTSDVTLRDCLITGFRNGTNLAGIAKFRTENVTIQNVRIGHEWNHMQTALLTNSRIVTGDGNAASACFKITGGNFFSNRIIVGEFGGPGFARFIEMTGGALYIDGANLEGFTSAQTINVAGAAGSKLEIKNSRFGIAYGASTSAIISCELNNNTGAPLVSVTNIHSYTGSPRLVEAWGTYSGGGAPFVFGGDPILVTYSATQGGAASDVVLIKPATSNYSQSSAFPVSGSKVGQFIQFSNTNLGPDDWGTNILLRQRNNHAGANQWSSIVNDMLARTLGVQGRTATGNNVETSLLSLTIPAGALRNNGESIEWRLYGKTAANANNKRFRFYWNSAMGGTPALDFGAIAMNDQDWMLTIHVQRGNWNGGSGSMKVSGKLEYGSSILVKTAADNLSGDTAAIATHVGVLTDTAASDVICYAAKATWLRAPSSI